MGDFTGAEHLHCTASAQQQSVQTEPVVKVLGTPRASFTAGRHIPPAIDRRKNENASQAGTREALSIRGENVEMDNQGNALKQAEKLLRLRWGAAEAAANAVDSSASASIGDRLKLCLPKNAVRLEFFVVPIAKLPP